VYYCCIVNNVKELYCSCVSQHSFLLYSFNFLKYRIINVRKFVTCFVSSLENDEKNCTFNFPLELHKQCILKGYIQF
jgi:hypothetical protein